MQPSWIRCCNCCGLSLSLSLSGARFGRWRQGTAAKFGVRCRRKGEQFRFRVRRQGDASLLQKPAHRATRRFTRQSGALRHDARRAKQIMACMDMGCTRRPTPALILTTLVGWSRHKRPRAGHAGALLAIICLSVIVVRPVAFGSDSVVLLQHALHMFISAPIPRRDMRGVISAN